VWGCVEKLGFGCRGIDRVCVGRDRCVCGEMQVCLCVWRDRMWVLMEKWGENVEGEKGGVWGCIWNER